MYTMIKYNTKPRKGLIGAMLITVGYLKYQTKLQIICDLSFLEYQGEVDLYIDWR